MYNVHSSYLIVLERRNVSQRYEAITAAGERTCAMRRGSAAVHAQVRDQANYIGAH